MTSADYGELLTFDNVSVNCKGQLWRGGSPVYIDKSLLTSCGFSRGTCASWSSASRVTKSQYCIADGSCVPHGPDEDSPGGPLDVIVVLTQPQWGAYYHFVIESLSRIAWVYKHRPSILQDNATYFHTGYISKHGQDWARAVGIRTELGKNNRLLDGWWHAKVALFPKQNRCVRSASGDRHFGGPDVYATRWMNERLLSFVPSLTTAPPYGGSSTSLFALLIIRDKRHRGAPRTIDNQDEVNNAVRRALHGWEVHDFSDWPKTPSFAETCVAFSQADLIVGPHGAGFANLLCARPGTPVVEYRKLGSPDYVVLSKTLNLPYFGFMSRLTERYVNPVDVCRYVWKAAGLVRGSGNFGEPTSNDTNLPGVCRSRLNQTQPSSATYSSNMALPMRTQSFSTGALPEHGASTTLFIPSMLTNLTFVFQGAASVPTVNPATLQLISGLLVLFVLLLVCRSRIPCAKSLAH